MVLYPHPLKELLYEAKASAVATDAPFTSASPLKRDNAVGDMPSAFSRRSEGAATRQSV